MPKLTDSQKRKIIAEYMVADGLVSISQLARSYGVSRQAISQILKSPLAQQVIAEKKAESDGDMQKFLADKQGQVKKLLIKILSKIDGKLDEDKIPLRDYVGAWKILTESYSPKTEQTDGREVKTVVFEFKDGNEDATDNNDT